MSQHRHIESSLATDLCEAELQRSLDGVRPKNLQWLMVWTVGHLAAAARAGEGASGLAARMGFDDVFGGFVDRYRLGPILDLCLKSEKLRSEPDRRSVELAADRAAYDRRSLRYKLGTTLGGRDVLVQKLMASEDRVRIPIYIGANADARQRLAVALTTLDALRAAAVFKYDLDAIAHRLGIDGDRHVLVGDPCFAAVLEAVHGAGSREIGTGPFGLRPRREPDVDQAA